VLRGEAASFVLSAFSLDLWSDMAQRPPSPDEQSTRQHLCDRLGTFLSGEPDSHVHVRRTALADHAARCDGPSYTVAFQPWIEGAERFVRPNCWAGKDCSRPSTNGTVHALLNIISRVRPDGLAADIWVRANHIGIDGVPLQDIVSRLESAWGTNGQVLYPTPEEFAPFTGPRECAGRAGMAEIQAFIDFTPLLAWRQRENARLAQPMTITAAILWRLARHPAFASTFIGTTVEVPAVDGLGRGVGVVVVRPANYANRRDGLAHFVLDFNRQISLTKQRRSAGCQTLDAAARIPAPLATALLRHALCGDRAFGSMGLTMIRDGKVFGAPLGDVGHDNGFMAIGSVTLPANDGRRVGCLTVKGPPAAIARYPALLGEIVNSCPV
jgi:hypothetical protein